MKAKKMFSAMMAGAMALSLVACGGSSASSSTAASSATQDTAATSTADSAPVIQIQMAMQFYIPVHMQTLYLSEEGSIVIYCNISSIY